MTKLDAKLAAHWLSEAWGADIPQSHIRVRPGWLFVRYPRYINDPSDSLTDPTWEGIGYRKIRKGWENEVDCLEAPILHTTDQGRSSVVTIYTPNPGLPSNMTTAHSYRITRVGLKQQ